MKISRFRLSVATAVLIALMGVFFIIDTYAEGNVKLPARFGTLDRFVPDNAVLYLEFPSLADGLAAFKASPAGKRFLSNPLTQEFLIRPVESRALALIRSLRAASGLSIDETSIFALLKNPFALILCGKQRAAIGILKMTTADRLLLSIFSRMGSALTGSDGLKRTVWSGTTLYTVHPGRPGAMTFALVNNVLLFSRHETLIKKALRTAATAAPSLPDDWGRFLAANTRTYGLFCRLYFRTAFLREVLPTGGALFLPERGRTGHLSMLFTPDLVIRGALEGAGNTPLDAASARLLAADNTLAFSGDFPQLGKMLDKELDSLDWSGDNAAPLRKALQDLLGRLRGGWLLTGSGLAEERARLFPSFTAVWRLAAGEAAAVTRSLDQLLNALPGVKTGSEVHLGVRFRTIPFRGGQDTGFTFCTALLGTTHLAFATTISEMRLAIASFLGRRRALLDAPQLAALRRELKGVPVTRIISLDLKKAVANLYSRLGDYAFRSPEFNRQDVMRVFGPILKTGLPWDRMDLVGSGRPDSDAAGFAIHFR